MRGVGKTLPRLPAARVMLAGAAFLAGSVPAAGTHAAGLGEDMAFANPRVPPSEPGRGLDGAGLPQPLAPSDAVRLRRIFRLQDQGDVAGAAAELTAVADPLLNGHVLAQRYLGRFTRASAGELATWLAQHGDHPDAGAVHALLLTRLAPGARVAEPEAAGLAADPPQGAAPEEDEPDRLRMQRNGAMDHFIHKLAHAGNADTALRMVARVPGLDPVYAGQLRAEIAQALFTQGRDEQALRVAAAVMQQTGGRIGLAGYVGGLAAWRLDRPETALALFEAASRAPVTSPSRRSGAAFWAARARLRTHDFAGYLPLMRQAAEARHTFYGLLARRTLGLTDPRPAARDTLGDADGAAVLATPRGRRALALLQVGQPRRAEAELRCLWPHVAANAALSGAVLRVAEAAGLTDLAAQLAGIIEISEGRAHDDARFPLPRLRPAGGFRIDPSLVYALTRLESNFEPNVVSSVGARGLMQLMPVTASYMSGDGGTALALNARRLHDPATNLALGQTYVLYLAASEAVGGDLIRLLASYNAGPASFARMIAGQTLPADPLLFIESIPNNETRGFVPRALTFSWIYAKRLRLPSPTLDELAAGAWPTVREIEVRHEQVARLH